MKLKKNAKNSFENTFIVPFSYETSKLIQCTWKCSKGTNFKKVSKIIEIFSYYYSFCIFSAVITSKGLYH